MLVVLKLGGSVITEKDTPETVDRTALGDVASDIASFLAERDAGLIVVHGGGSFGHHHAAEHGVSTTDGTRDPKALTSIHGAMCDLNRSVLDAFHERGVRALPVRPLSVAYRTAADTVFSPDGIEVMLTEGFVPVVQADVVVHDGSGGTVLSGDEIVVSLAESLAADRIGLCSTVPGVLDGSGEVIPEITSLTEVAGVLGESETTDVSGGMAGKVRRLLELDVPAAVFDSDALTSFLREGTAGTVISPQG